MICENTIPVGRDCRQKAEYTVTIYNPGTDVEPPMVDTFHVCEDCVEEFTGFHVEKIAVDLGGEKS